MARFNPRLSTNDRFDLSYSPEPNSGCWLWDAAISSHKNGGRPKITHEGRRISAYRYSYHRFVGPIPADRIICHKCNVSICVNPDHLYAGTLSDNNSDSVRAGTNHFARHGKELSKLAVEARKARGPSIGQVGRKSVLSEPEWLEIERRVALGERPYAVAENYPITGQSLKQMLDRRELRASLGKQRGRA